jgi:hypothetical protein
VVGLAWRHLGGGTSAGAVHAEYRGGSIRIGVLNDQSGLYADIAGTASVWVARCSAHETQLKPFFSWTKQDFAFDFERVFLRT